MSSSSSSYAAADVTGLPDLDRDRDRDRDTDRDRDRDRDRPRPTDGRINSKSTTTVFFIRIHAPPIIEYNELCLL